MLDQKNTVIAIILSIAILFGFQYFVEAPRQQKLKEQQAIEQATNPAKTEASTAPVPGAGSLPQSGPVAPEVVRAEVLNKGPRLPIDAKRIHGSIALQGGRIDDITLTDYKITLDADSKPITLLSPAGSSDPYYSEVGWTVAPGTNVKVPDATTLWKADADRLVPGKALKLTWDNGEGLIFGRTIELDQNYMFRIVQTVENKSGAAVALFPYALISRHGTPTTDGLYILHEGPLGVFRAKAEEGGTLKEISYSDVIKDKRIEQTSTGGWVGFTDKYWLTALVAPNQAPIRATFSHVKRGPTDLHQVDYLGGAVEIPAAGRAESETRLFAGAKEVRVLDQYQDNLGIPRFDRAIDWGWFYFLTKPIFFAIDFFYHLIGNFGIAILCLTVVVKTLFLPLAYKSYVSMSAMKDMQPEMVKLRERYADDRQRMQQELMELYKREKINPAAGCLPILLQIPVFFSLYKVIYIAIEMRHAPFYGWIHDLSAPDPTTFLNLFGLLPYTVPHLGPLQIVNLGIWPLLMGISMWAQMRMNPTPPDPVQAKIFAFMPIVFTFMLGSFAAGLIIYWTWNNILSVGQQWFITRRLHAKKEAARLAAKEAHHKTAHNKAPPAKKK